MKLYATLALIGISVLFSSLVFSEDKDRFWSGTITLDETYSGITGTSEKHVTINFTKALPTLYREHPSNPEFNFTDDKGPGTVTYHSEAIIGGQHLGTADCSGNGKGELHEVVIDEEKKVYSISAIGPPCVGSNSDGSPYGPEQTDIIIPDHSLTDPNVVSGSMSGTAEMPGGQGKVTTRITWNLTQGKTPDVELIVTPADYDKWLPTPGHDELMKGSVMEVSFKLQAHGGGAPAQKAESFDVKLSGTSKEPGIALNAPLKPSSNQLPDLRLIPLPVAESGEDDQFLNVGSPDGVNGKTYIASYDGGGYSTLTVEAILKGDHKRIKGHLLVPAGDTDILIPKRLPNSHIATVWANANGNPQDDDDKEKSPGNSNDGDGYSAYEEYRGVISEDKFKRLDPEEKELAVRIWSWQLPSLKEGMDLFESASGLTIVRLHIYEVAQSRRVNQNSGTSHLHGAFAIPLMIGSLPPGVAGITYSTTGEIELPKRSTAVVISVQNNTEFYQSVKEKFPNAPYTLDEMIATTIAHELSHAVDVPHHGDLPEQPTPDANDNTFTVFDQFGKDITYRVEYPLPGKTGLPGSAESGDVSCLMVYNPYYGWALTENAIGRKIYSEVPFFPLGRSLCKSRVGTGINAPSANPGVQNKYFGKATNGNCLSKIKLWEPD